MPDKRQDTEGKGTGTDGEPEAISRALGSGGTEATTAPPAPAAPIGPAATAPWPGARQPGAWPGARQPGAWPGTRQPGAVPAPPTYGSSWAGGPPAGYVPPSGFASWALRPAAWPIGYVPWGYTRPPALAPVLEPPGMFHPPASRRPILSLAGRASPRLYGLGLAVGLPGITALLLYLVALGAGMKPPGGPVPRWLVLEFACVAAAVGAVAWAVAQGRQRRADAWRDYAGPSPLPTMAALLAIVTAFEIPLEAGLNAARVDVESGLATLLLVMIFLSAYVGLVHFLAVRPHALAWRDIARPARLAPDSDDWDALEPVPGWTRRPGELIGSWRARSPGGRLGDILVALLMVGPLILASNLLSGAMLQVLGLHTTDISGPETYIATTDLDRLLMFIAVAIVAPLGEEIFFRGFATNAWGRSLGRGATMIRSSLFFAFIHVLNTATTDVGVFWRVALFNFGARIPVAIALTWLYMRRRSILASGALHATYNGLITIISFL